MCGRAVADFTDEDVKNDVKFGITEVERGFKKNYNVAPTDQIPVIVQGSRILSTYRWGLIPSWAKDVKIGYKMINARSESLIEKPSFKNLIKERKCLVLISGFLEWDKEKNPHLISKMGEKIIALAGLWDEWSDGEEKIRSCTIITVPANKFMKELHNRMPVILNPEDYEKWLTSSDFKEVRGLLIPCKDDELKEIVVSKEIGNVRNNRKELLDGVEV